ncbi:MAG: hypothetical protein IKJ05_04545 [Oscillospiraceae bacterium]|nr:hypothetical protein [Oscillospiraceae bacterium]
MSEKQFSANVKMTYDNVCHALDKIGLPYNKFEQDLAVTSSVYGEDMLIDFIMAVDNENNLVKFLSRLPFIVTEEKRFDMAIAICTINNKLADGCFDYNIASGDIIFRLSYCFKDSVLNVNVFEQMFYTGIRTVDHYNIKLFNFSEGNIELADFIRDLSK